MKRLSEFIFGPKSGGVPPARVQRHIAREQQEAEKLIGWVQLALVLIFTLLYSLAPKTSAGTAFQPVPWAIGLYLLFTLTRLGCAYRNFLPTWLLVSSAIMDMALLMSLIWSFHIQYEQPPSFYLKAPTVMYVFIFIALRTLRFEPRYILMTGAAAIVGWASMVAYVMLSDAGNTMITRDYVAYLTSNALLVGAEVDKILSMFIVTVVLAVAVMRAQRTLNKSVQDAVAAEDLSRFVSREVAERIISADRAIQPGDGEARIGSVIFTDIEGFSSTSEKLSPEALATMLNEYFEALSEVIERYGGVVTQFQGDMMLITYNAVCPDEHHADNAVRTAIGIQEVAKSRVYSHGGRLATRCGINTGELVIGAIGSRERLTFTVHGDQVNVAARLEPLNKQYGTYVLVGERTVAACTEPFPFREIGTVTVRGREGETRIYTLDL